MRRWLVLLFLPLVPVAAQEDAPLGEDPSGDVASNFGLPTTPGTPAIDLRSFDIVEDGVGFHLIVGVEDLDAGTSAEVVLLRYAIELEHAGAKFRVVASRTGGADFFSMLTRYDAGSGTYRYTTTLSADPDSTADTLTVHVPRELLRDDNGAVPHPGRALSGLAVSASANQITVIPVSGQTIEAPHFTDHLPDEGVLAAVHDITHGVGSSGHLLLESEEPFRASNGEATTFLFPVKAVNEGEADHVRFEATRFPPQWEVTLPPDMEIGAGMAVDVTVVVRTAFAHSHGGTESFVLSMHSERDPAAVGRIEIGVHYPLIPQPAGHHDTLWFHSYDLSDDPLMLALYTALSATFSQTGLLQDEYINALEEDERADDVPAEAAKCQLLINDPQYPAGTQYCWRMELDPGLLLGLDFDVRRNGTLLATIGSTLPLPAASLEGRLLYFAPVDDDNPASFFFRDEVVLATIPRSDPVDLVANNHGYELPVVPTPEADFIPYARGAALMLELSLNTLRPDTSFFGPPLPAPVLHMGGHIQLPLNEYADPVAQVASLGGGLHVSAVSEQRRPVNPGETVVFVASIENNGNATEAGLELIGSNREWARLLAPARMHMGADDKITVAVAVTPPAGTTHGDMADLVLQVTNLGDVTDRNLLRFVASVDTEVDHPDENDIATTFEPAAKKSPGLAPLAIAALLGLLARRRPNA